MFFTWSNAQVQQKHTAAGFSLWDFTTRQKWLILLNVLLSWWHHKRHKNWVDLRTLVNTVVEEFDMKSKASRLHLNSCDLISHNSPRVWLWWLHWMKEMVNWTLTGMNILELLFVFFFSYPTGFHVESSFVKSVK